MHAPPVAPQALVALPGRQTPSQHPPWHEWEGSQNVEQAPSMQDSPMGQSLGPLQPAEASLAASVTWASSTWASTDPSCPFATSGAASSWVELSTVTSAPASPSGLLACAPPHAAGVHMSNAIQRRMRRKSRSPTGPPLGSLRLRKTKFAVAGESCRATARRAATSAGERHLPRRRARARPMRVGTPRRRGLFPYICSLTAVTLWAAAVHAPRRPLRRARPASPDLDPARPV